MSLILHSQFSILPRSCLHFIPRSSRTSFLSVSRNSKFTFTARSSFLYSFNDPVDPSSEPHISSVDGPDEPEEKSVDDVSEFRIEISSNGGSAADGLVNESDNLGSEPPRDLSGNINLAADEVVNELVAESEGLGHESPMDLSGEGIPVADGVDSVNVNVNENGAWALKRALVDTVFGTNLGFSASAEIRAETLELVSQLEALNPTPSPTSCPELLDGKWVLVYTAFSELFPLLAAESILLTKIEKISQSVNTSTRTIENSITVSNPVSTVSFSASASFEVQSPSRIQVEFKEGKFNPPEIKSRIDLPESASIFGQNISLSWLQQSLNPIQNIVGGIAEILSGQPPLRIPIPGEQSNSWLLTTYLDEDFRISRGDGGLFVLAKEGSQLLET